MQMVIAIADINELMRYGGAKQALFRSVSGVPLLERVLATGLRAGADRALIVHRQPLRWEIKSYLRNSKFLRGLHELEFVEVANFDPAFTESWWEIFGNLEDEFVWLPWNWVTNKHSIAGLELFEARPKSWDCPVRLSRFAVLGAGPAEPLPRKDDQGSLVTSQSSVKDAERWLVAHSGKPLDGIYSKFNRWLCRPLVRALTHTFVTPNMVTFAGLLLAVAAGYYFAEGNYWASLIGALLFFASGLLDEVDGMLARVRFADSPLGTWLEGTVDNVSYLLLFIGITIGLYQQYGSQEVLIGEAAIAGAILAVGIIAWQRKRSTRADRPQEYLGNVYKLLDKDRSNWISRSVRVVHIFLKKGVFIHYVLLFTALGLLPVFLRLAAFASNLTWIIALYFSFRFFRRREPGARIIELSKAA